MSTKAKAPKKSAAKKTTAKKLAPEVSVKQAAKRLPKNSGTIEKIITLARKGYTKKQIIDAGFNKNTVYRQVREQLGSK